MGQRAKKVETGIAVELSSSLATKRNSGNRRHRSQSANPKLSENARSVEKCNLFTSAKSNIAELTFSTPEVPVIQRSRVLRSREVLSVDTAGKKKRRKTATIDTDRQTDQPVLARISSGLDHTTCVNVSASLGDPASHVPDEMQIVGDVQDSLHEESPHSGNNVLNCEAVNVHKRSVIPDSRMGIFDGVEEHVGDQAEPPTPITKLLKAYDKICKKYKRSKARRLQEIEALFEDQKRRETAHSKATSVLVELLRKENLWLKHQIEETNIEDTVLRLRLLEHENAECRNDLLMVCAKNLELVEEIQNLRSSVLSDADTVARHDSSAGDESVPLFADAGGERVGDVSESEGMVIAETKGASLSKEALNKIKMPATEQKDCCLLQVLLQSITKLQLLVDTSLEPSQLTFLHHPTGLKFKLEQTVDENIAQYCGGGGELRVEMISLGTLKPRAPQWMHDILTFSIKHVHLFFSRIHAAIDAIPSSSIPGA
ncbi:hypothetical protein O6H91_11G052900 [Diphasiastrum complanatum]|uniref:Uncharacterized protein n=2 Tax=Diphasiastrum complanatum TaxID=34168 RepID=A0ACC2C980_DIPCM|nr:hypothetical protein O6H91_11G052900 [Diphasiastrum complanatum]KAJ7538526.1 hypothetical protein O6H91_11G052900 [Diphasiastrum complanatum]